MQALGSPTRLQPWFSNLRHGQLCRTQSCRWCSTCFIDAKSACSPLDTKNVFLGREISPEKRNTLNYRTFHFAFLFHPMPSGWFVEVNLRLRTGVMMFFLYSTWISKIIETPVYYQELGLHSICERAIFYVAPNTNHQSWYGSNTRYCSEQS